MRERTDQYSSDDHLGFRLVIDNIKRYPLYQKMLKPENLDSITRASVMESIGAAEITIEYDRLAIDGRENNVWGGVVAFGKPWSPGDDLPSTWTVSKDVSIHGQTLPAGRYQFSLVPDEIPEGGSKWDIIFSQQDKEVLRVKTRAQLEDNTKERMEYFFDEREPDTTRIVRFLWEFVEVHIPIEDKQRTIGEVAKAAVMNAMYDTEVKVNYYRAVAAGRNIYGGIVPYQQAGAKEATRIEFSKPVLVDGHRVEAGEYYFSLIPSKKTRWQLLLRDVSNNISQTITLKIKPELAQSGGPDRLEYFFSYINNKERILSLAWDRVGVEINIKALD